MANKFIQLKDPQGNLLFPRTDWSIVLNKPEIPTMALVNSKQDQLTSANAGDNITITSVGGVLKINAASVTDYTALSNKPSINGVTLTGALTAADLGLAWLRATSNGDFEIADASGNVIIRLVNGHVYTQNFDSSDLMARVTMIEQAGYISASNFTALLSNALQYGNYPVSYFNNDAGYLNQSQVNALITSAVALKQDILTSANAGTNVTITTENGVVKINAAGTQGMTNPMTTAGDIIIGGTNGAPARLGIGASGYLLMAVNGQPRWTQYFPVVEGDAVLSSDATAGQILTADGDGNAYWADPTATGTVRSIRIQGTSPIQSSVNTTQTVSLDTTISLANGYGDIKNPYGSKTAHYVLAAPANAAGAPSFRALVASDIPALDYAATNHTHSTSINSSSGTAAITLAMGGKYLLSTGGTSIIFAMPHEYSLKSNSSTGTGFIPYLDASSLSYTGGAIDGTATFVTSINGGSGTYSQTMKYLGVSYTAGSALTSGTTKYVHFSQGSLPTQATAKTVVSGVNWNTGTTSDNRYVYSYSVSGGTTTATTKYMSTEEESVVTGVGANGTSNAVTGISGGSGSMSGTRSTSGSGNSARRTLAISHTHTAASASGNATVLTGVKATGTTTAVTGITYSSSSGTGEAFVSSISSTGASGSPTYRYAAASTDSVTGMASAGSLPSLTINDTASGGTAMITSVSSGTVGGSVSISANDSNATGRVQYIQSATHTHTPASVSGTDTGVTSITAGSLTATDKYLQLKGD